MPTPNPAPIKRTVPGFQGCRFDADQAAIPYSSRRPSRPIRKLRVLGLRRRLATGTAISSAWVPSRVKPVSSLVPQTSTPIHSAGPASTTPAKSRPGMRGALVWLIAPARFFTSLGLIQAAITRTNAALLVGSRGGNLGYLKNRGIAEGLEPCRAHGPLLQAVIYVPNL